MKTLKRVGFVVLAIIVLAGIASCFGSDDEGKESVKKEVSTEKVSTTEFTYDDKDVVLVNEGNTWHAEALGRRVPYTGTVQNEYGIWYVKDGQLAEDYNGTGSYNGQDAVFRNGRVASETTGLISAGDQWYYVQAGIIQHGYTGLAKNSAGTWYVENGAVDFNKSGEYTENGVTYVISGGAATVKPAETTTVPVRQESSARTYILNIKSGKFHEPGCRGLNQANESNLQEVTDTRENIMSQGYEPCGICNP